MSFYGGYPYWPDDYPAEEDNDDVIIPHVVMPKLSAGDMVSCIIQDSAIVNPNGSYDHISSFMVVAKDDEGYYLFVPNYQNLKNSIVCTAHKCNTLQIDKKYLNENIVYISENMIMNIVKQNEGLNCYKCNEFVRFAEQNIDDKFVCYGCRINPYR